MVVDNAKSGPAGVASHGRWLYGGDGDSALHVIDLDAPPDSATKQVISTGGSFRMDKMALTSDDKLHSPQTMPSDLGGIPIDYQHHDFVKEIHCLTVVLAGR
jgi:hypothetical protein